MDVVIGAPIETPNGVMPDALAVAGSYLKIGVEGTGTVTGSSLILNLEAW